LANARLGPKLLKSQRRNWEFGKKRTKLDEGGSEKNRRSVDWGGLMERLETRSYLAAADGVALAVSFSLIRADFPLRSRK
jgi:hypothetical protein